MLTFNQKVELSMIAVGGGWSLATVLLFATQRYSAAYSMVAFGTIITSALALVRVAANPDAALPGAFLLAEDPKT